MLQDNWFLWNYSDENEDHYVLSSWTESVFANALESPFIRKNDQRWAEVLLTKCGPDAGHRDMEWTNHRQRRFNSMFTLPPRIWQLKDNLATIAVLINGHLRLLSNLSASRAASAPDVAHISTLSRLFTVTCAGNDFWRDFAEAHLLT